MKVFEPDCKFEDHPSMEWIEYNGERYKIVRVHVMLDDGHEEEVVLAPYCLEEELLIDAGGYDKIDRSIDDEISFYASDDDSIYYCLEQVTGEEIV